MKKKRINRNLLFMILLLCVTIGYAYLNSELRINGTTGIAGNSWDIHFENVVPSQSNTATVNVAPVANPQDKVTELTYSVRFNKPGDIYAFDVDIVNAGSIDAMVKLYTSTIKVGNGEIQNVSSTSIPSYLSYYVTYSDGAPIQIHQLLEANESETIRVYVEYKKNISNEELEESAGETINFNIDIEYIQATDDAIEKPDYLECTYNGNLIQGAEYINGQYTYRYMQEYNGTAWSNMDNDGWGVTLTDKTSTDPVTSELCSIINNKPIVSMSNMFKDSLTTSIDTSSYNTSRVINMSNMFNNASSITSIDLSHLGGDNLTDINQIFYNASSLKDIDMSYFNFGTITDLSSSKSIFKYIDSIENINLSHANMRNVTTMNYGITRLNTLKTIDLSYADLRNATDLSSLARDNGNLTSFDISYARTDSVEQLYYAFKDSYSLKDINLTGISLENVIDMKYMFYHNPIKTMDLSEFRTPNLQDAHYLFYECPNLEEVNISNLGSDVLVTVNAMFAGSNKIKKITMDNFNFGVANLGGYIFDTLTSLEEISLKNAIIKNAPNSHGIFYYNRDDLSALKKIDLTGVEFGTSMNQMFSELPALTTIDFTDVDTSSVTDMFDLFYYSKSLVTLDLSSFDVSNVTDMRFMFEDCTSLTTIYVLESWDTTNVIEGNALFFNDTNLVGGNGTTYDSSRTNKEYARIDSPGSPGYFTLKT